MKQARGDMKFLINISGSEQKSKSKDRSVAILLVLDLKACQNKDQFLSYYSFGSHHFISNKEKRNPERH